MQERVPGHAALSPLLMIIAVLIAGGAALRASENPYDGLPRVKWKMSQSQAPDHFMNNAYEKMANYLKDKSGGKFTVDIYHSGTLGTEQEIIENMQMGTIAGTMGAASLVANFVPCFELFSIPALFSDENQLATVMSDPSLMGKIEEACKEADLYNYGYFQNFLRQLYSKKKLEKIGDFTGQKIRVMGSPPFIDAFQELGCNATTTAWSELYSALQLGVCDGLDHVAASVKANAFYENLNYVAEPRLFATPMFVLISKPMYDKLPKPYQELVDEAVTTVLLPELRREADKTNAEALHFMVTDGKLERVECDVADIHKAVIPVRNKYIGRLEPWVQEIAKEIVAGRKE